MSTEQPDDRSPPPSGPGDPLHKQPPPGEPQQQPPYGGGSPYGDPYGSADATAGPSPGPFGPGEAPVAGMPPLASRGRRLLARIIDALIIGIPVAVIAGAASGFTYDDSGGAYWQGGLYTLAYFVYEALMLSNSGQTLGKRWMRVRVAVLENGAVPTGSPAWLRAAVYQLPTLVPCIGSLFWLVNVLFCTWDQPYHQCLHDKAAKTVVVAVT